jgi:hypothetical protein
MHTVKPQIDPTFDRMVAFYILAESDNALPRASFEATQSTLPPEGFVYRIVVSAYTYRVAFGYGDWDSELPVIIYNDGAIVLFLNHVRSGRGRIFMDRHNGWFLAKVFVLLVIAHTRTKSKEERIEFCRSNAHIAFETNPFQTIEENEAERQVLEELDWPLPIDRRRVRDPRRHDWMQK